MRTEIPSTDTYFDAPGSPDLLASIVACLTLTFHRWWQGRHVFDHQEALPCTESVV
jgi:hypothetical protein